MTEIVLHRLPGTKKALEACRLVEELYLAERKVVVWLSDPRKAEVLDQYLWTFADQSFVPHARWSGEGAEDEAVVIVGGALANPHGADVLVLLDRMDDPSGLSVFAEVHDFVTPAPEDADKEALWESSGFPVRTEKGVRSLRRRG